MARNAAATLAKWKRNAQNAAQDLKDGVMGVTVAPTVKAAQQKDKYLRKVQEAVASGKYEKALNESTLQEWQAAMQDKGAQNYTNGVSKVSPKAAKAMADQQAFAEQVKQTISAMPSATEADMEQRSLVAQRMMREYGKR